MFEGISSSIKSYTDSASKSASNLASSAENSAEDSIFLIKGSAEAFRVTHGLSPWKDVTYAVKKDDGTWSKAYTKAYSQGIVDSLDSNNDNVVDAKDDIFSKEFAGTGQSSEEIFKKFDANGNNRFDADDNEALMAIQDKSIKDPELGKKDDGVLTPSEIQAGIDYVVKNPNGAKKMQESYSKNVGL